MPPEVSTCVLVDPKAPPEFGPAPSLEEALDVDVELRALLLRDARLDDACAVAWRVQGGLDAVPRIRAWPLFAALDELRQVELRIRLLKEAINGR